MTYYWIFAFLLIAAVGVTTLLTVDSSQRRRQAEESERQRQAQMKEDSLLRKISDMEEEITDLRGELNGIVDSLEADSFR